MLDSSLETDKILIKHVTRSDKKGPTYSFLTFTILRAHNSFSMVFGSDINLQ